MADTPFKLWCLIKGETRFFSVTVTDVSIDVDDLTKMIKKEAQVDHPAYTIELWKVRCFWGFVLTLWVTPLYP